MFYGLIMRSLDSFSSFGSFLDSLTVSVLLGFLCPGNLHYTVPTPGPRLFACGPLLIPLDSVLPEINFVVVVK